MCAASITVQTTTPSETASLAASLGARLVMGDAVLLEGEIGAGKTHFARALIQSLQVFPEDVPSPTYTLVQIYETANGTIWHSDLYRLTSLDELEELGLNEALETATCLIEWPDRMGQFAPKDALTLRLVASTDHPDTRHITLSWNDPKWDQRLKGLNFD